MACCSCCLKTGACCNDGVCSEETCADCESAGGVFQGYDTVCVFEDQCPCSPPADPLICQRCVGGRSVGYCPSDGFYPRYLGSCCTDGICKPCPPPYCPEEPCTGDDCCVDGQCVPCPEPTCPEESCTGDLCCVDGYCVVCPEYDCVPECGPGFCCVDSTCVSCTPCDPGDCPEGQCCVDGFCTDCPDPCEPGTCPDAWCCVDGYCIPCPPPECPYTPCPSGECCINGYCINPCPEGEYCCNGVCQEEPCDSDCSGACDPGECEEGCMCCDGLCSTEYCYYRAEVVWDGEGEGDECPAGFEQSGLSPGGKRICGTCLTEPGPCDEEAWWEGVAPDDPWQLVLNSFGVDSQCTEGLCFGECDPEYPGSCCPGCRCVEMELDGVTFYECQPDQCASDAECAEGEQCCDGACQDEGDPCDQEESPP